MKQSNDLSTRFRLLTEIDGQRRTFSLEPGLSVVGNGATCQVQLTQRGVSRRHAELSLSGAVLELRDLESKNGSFVNGQRIEIQRLQAGDALRIGPVHLTLEAIDAEDAELGMILDPSTHTDAVSVAPPDDTTLLSRSEFGDAAPMQIIDSIVERLLMPVPDLEGTLRLLLTHLGAPAGCWVEWPRRGAPVVIAAVGALIAMPSAEAIRGAAKSRRDPQLRHLIGDTDPFPTTVARWGPGHDPFGLVVWGDFPRRRQQLPLLSIILRLAQSFRPSLIGDLGDGSTPQESQTLNFPQHIVRGESASMVALYQQMKLLLQGDVPTLILGETGVGKEHLALTLHRSSARQESPFVAINCAAIPAELLEAEMFGIGRGVATGVQQRLGKFQEAQGGTLFLDEIGDMSAALQAKLLRALQEKEIHPLGLGPVAIDVRIIAATNTDLRQRISQGAFREDLYYRLAGYVLEVPPLRRRLDDIRRLVAHFVRQFCRETGKSVRGLTVKTLRALDDYPWPGNVRELEHEIRRLVYLCPHEQAIDSDMLSRHILAPSTRPSLDLDDVDDDDLDLEKHIETLERHLIRKALAKTGGNQSGAARLLKVSRNGLAKRLKRLDIDLSEWVV